MKNAKQTPQVPALPGMTPLGIKPNDDPVVAECWTCGRNNRLVAQPFRTPHLLTSDKSITKHRAAGHDVRPVTQHT